MLRFSLMLCLAFPMPTAGQAPTPLLNAGGTFVGLSVPDLEANAGNYIQIFGR